MEDTAIVLELELEVMDDVVTIRAEELESEDDGV